MNFETFNRLSNEERASELFKCCGSENWSKALAKKTFNSLDDLIKESDRIWFSASEEDWRQAFTHHPKIGDLESLKKKFVSTAHWTQGEQSGVNKASEEILKRLKIKNDEYEKKFGYIFIVYATGKSAEEMLSLLSSRINNLAWEEIQVAMKEQNKITHLRLEKLFA